LTHSSPPTVALIYLGASDEEDNAEQIAAYLGDFAFTHVLNLN
jgi:hypothetical protein